MSNKYIKLENLIYYDSKIKEYISNNIGTSNGVVIYDDYSKLPNDLTEDTIAYCEGDYVEVVTDGTNDNIISETTRSKGFYLYDNVLSAWRIISEFDENKLDSYIKKEKLVKGDNIEIETDTENNIIITSFTSFETREW